MNILVASGSLDAGPIRVGDEIVIKKAR